MTFNDFFNLLIIPTLCPAGSQTWTNIAWAQLGDFPAQVPADLWADWSRQCGCGWDATSQSKHHYIHFIFVWFYPISIDTVTDIFWHSHWAVWNHTYLKRGAYITCQRSGGSDRKCPKSKILLFCVLTDQLMKLQLFICSVLQAEKFLRLGHKQLRGISVRSPAVLRLCQPGL